MMPAPTWQCEALITVTVNTFEAHGTESTTIWDSQCLLTAGHTESRHLSKDPDGTLVWWTPDHPPAIGLKVVET